jgi:hypothetical protein
MSLFFPGSGAGEKIACPYSRIGSMDNRRPTVPPKRDEWAMDPADVRRAARRMREHHRPDPLRRIALYGAAALAVVALVAAYLNRETLLGLRIDASALTSLFSPRSSTDVGAPGENREGESTVEAPAVVGTRAPTSLDGEPESPASAATAAPAQNPPAANPSAAANGAVERNSAAEDKPAVEQRPGADREPQSESTASAQPAPAPAPAPAAVPEPAPAPPEPENFEPGLEHIEVSESAPNATLLVIRYGDRSRASAVTWWTEEGTAKAGSDYVNLGMLSEKFAAGEQNRALHIPIVGDHNREGPESFFVVVRTRAGDGADIPVLRAEVVINDDD